METIASVLPFIQIVLAILVIAGILMQHSEEGLGSAFGSGGDAAFKHTRRGFEKVLFYATIIASILFVLSTLAALTI